jgi:uncharacterized protein HemX
MEENNNNSPENIQPAQNRKNSIKWKVYFVLIIILIGAGAYGYYWYKQTSQLRNEAQAVIGRAEKFDVLESSVNAERDRCEKFIAQKEGDFGSFEYCKKFIGWADILPISQ